MVQKFKTIIFACSTLLLAGLLIFYPSESLAASTQGLTIWWEVVFPSLLPFFILAELFIAFGVVSFVGVLFEPIMRPLFNVPGEGSFAWILGMASGYPAGAKIAARLREQKALTQIEAERLLTFTNASSPLFMFGAIAVGFFHNAALGLLIAICHYVGNFLVGICMRFHGQKSDFEQKKQEKRISFKNALAAMHRSRLKDGRPFGEMLGDSVLHSIQTLIMVGGFIVLFSVLTSLLSIIGLIPFLAQFISFAFQMLSLPTELALPFLSGLFEISLGAQFISQITMSSVLFQALLLSFLLGFNGFSIQAQVSSIIAKTDIRFSPYFFARILHGIFSSLLTLIFFDFLYVRRKAKETIGGSSGPLVEPNFWTKSLTLFESYGFFFTMIFLGIGTFLLCKKSYHKYAEK